MIRQKIRSMGGNDRTFRVLNYLIAYKKRTGGCTPTLRDICDEADISSTSVAAHHLDVLKLSGLVEYVDRGKMALSGAVWNEPEWTAELAGTVPE